MGRVGLSPDCERVRRLHPDGVPAGLRDVHRVRDPPRRAGRACRCGCIVIKPVEEREQGHDHPVLDAIRATPEYLPDPQGLTKPLHLWRYRRRPRVPARAAALRASAARTASRAPRAPPSRRPSATAARRSRGPRKIYIKELIQAITLADALDPDVRHLHAHFAHGTTTITWLAACITGLPFSFTGHARDIYAPELNPKGWLRRKLLAARFVVTCTEANVAAPAGDRAAGPRPPRLPRPLGGLHDLLRADGDAPRAQRPAAHPRRRPARGQEGLRRAWSTRARCSQERGVAVRRADRRPGRQGRRRAARAGSPSSARPCALPGPDRPGGPAATSTAAPARCACRAACSRPTATASRTCSSRRWPRARRSSRPNVSGIPELVEHEVNGLLVEPDDPQALADALLRLHDDPELTRRLTAQRPRDRPRALRRRPPRPRARRPLPGGAVITADAARAPCCASTSTSTATARWPTPSPRGVFTLRRRDARARRRARLAARAAARRRGVADRLGQVLLRARPRRRVPRHRRPPLPRRVGAARRELHPPGPAGPRPERGHRAPDPELDLRVAAAAGGVDRRRSSSRACASRRSTCATRSPPERNHRTLELYALLLTALALPDLVPGLLELATTRAAREPAGRLRRRRRAPRAQHALPHDRPALVRRRARELPPLRRRAAARASTSG